MTIKTITIIFTCGLLLNLTAHGADPLLEPPYSDIRELLLLDPESAINELDKLDLTNLSNEHVASHFFIYSQAYFGLSYPQKALDEAEKGIQFLGKTSNVYFYRLLMAKALALSFLSKDHEAIELLDSVIEWSQNNTSLDTLVNALASRGSIHFATGNVALAVKDYTQGYELAPTEENRANPLMLTKSSFQFLLADVYTEQGEYQAALDLINQFIKVNIPKQQYIELSVAHYKAGKLYFQLDDLEKARHQYEQSVQAAIKVNDDQGVGYALVEFAKIDRKQGNYSSAEQQLDQAMSIFQRGNVPEITVEIYMERALIYIEKDELSMAHNLISQITERPELESLPNKKVEVLDIWAELFARQKDYAQAYEKVLEARQLEAKLSQAALKEKALELRVAHEVTEQKRLADRQKLTISNQYAQTRLLSVIIALLVLSVLLIAVIAFRIHRARSRIVSVASRDFATGALTGKELIRRLKTNVDNAKRTQTLLHCAVIKLKFPTSYSKMQKEDFCRFFIQSAHSVLRQIDEIGRVNAHSFAIVIGHSQEGGANVALERFINMLTTRAHRDDVVITYELYSVVGKFAETESSEIFSVVNREIQDQPSF